MEIDSVPPPPPPPGPQAAITTTANTRPPVVLEVSVPTEEPKHTMMDVEYTATTGSVAALSEDVVAKLATSPKPVSNLGGLVSPDAKKEDPNAWPVELKRVVAPSVMRVKDSNVSPSLHSKMDELFSNWLSLPSTKGMLKDMLRHVEQGEEAKILSMAMETLASIEETMGKMPVLGTKLSSIKSRQVAQPVFRFMDGITGMVLRSAPPRSPSRKPKTSPMDLDKMDMPLDLGQSASKIDGSNESEEKRELVDVRRDEDTAMVDHREGNGHADQPGPVDAPHLNGHAAEGVEVEPEEDALGDQDNALAFAAQNLVMDSGDEGPGIVVDQPSPIRQSRLTVIPKFFPRVNPVLEELEQQELETTRTFFEQQREHTGKEGATREAFSELIVVVGKLPSYIGTVVFDKILSVAPAPNGDLPSPSSPATSEPSTNGTSADEAPETNKSATQKIVTEEQFVEYYMEYLRHRTSEERIFSVLRAGANRDYLVAEDFKPMTLALLQCHPGLQFLRSTPEFQQRYCETVIQRIYYGCSRMNTSRLTVCDIKRSHLLDTLMGVDQEDDINKERRFFSYEHFYVLYCRFWELDSDHDLLIDRDDLMRYGTHALSYRIVDRIFGGYGRPLDCKSQEEGKMTYTDFVWFCISEEDKTTDTAIDYWFRCVDLDGDGFITLYDMEYFYKEQLHRLECFGSETISIRDMFCQLFDMIKPNISPPVISRRDLKNCRLASVFFNTLFNVNKYFVIEFRDPSSVRQEQACPDLSDWDRFAYGEYVRLSTEDDYDDLDAYEDGQNEVAPMIGEAPF